MAETAAQRAARTRAATTTTTAPPKKATPVPRESVATPQPQLNSDLAKLADKRQLTYNASSAADPNDPPVLVVRGIDYENSVATPRPGGDSVATPVLNDVRKLSDLQLSLYRMDEEHVAALQKRLKAGGFMEGAYQEGVPDEETLKAYTTALKRAANYLSADNKVTLDEVIDAGKEAKKQGEGFVAVLSDPVELKNTIRKVSTIVAGQYLPEPVLDQIWQEYRAQEQATQYQKFELGENNETGSVNSLPSFQTFAEQKIREVAPEKAGAQDLAGRAQEFYDLLGGGVSGSKS